MRIPAYNRAYDVFALLYRKKFRDLRTADFQAVLDAHPGINQHQDDFCRLASVRLQFLNIRIRKNLLFFLDVSCLPCFTGRSSGTCARRTSRLCWTHI